MRLFIFFIYLNSFGQSADFKNVNFEKADSIALNTTVKGIIIPKYLSRELTKNLDTKIEKFRSIYMWVTHNIILDNVLYYRVTRKQKKYINNPEKFLAWNKTIQEEFLNRLLKKKRTVCTGYAYLVKKIANYAKINCLIVDGYGRTTETNLLKYDYVNHSWNVVRLNNKWYLCDPTWSAGYSGKNSFKFEYNNGYFLAIPEQFATNHFPKKPTWKFLNLTKENFINAPLVYGSAFIHQAIPIYPKTLKNIVKKKSIVEFQFKSSKNIILKDISLVEIRENKTFTNSIYDLKKYGNIYKFKYKFRHRGFYDVHLRIKKDILFTYSFKVVKKSP